MTFTESETRAYLAAVLPQAHENGDGMARCPCPIHHGTNQNFVIKVATGECYCHSKCGKGGDLIWLERGRTGASFAVARRNVFSIIGRVVEPEKRIVAVYDYVDEQGERLYQSVRYEPKDFKLRQNENVWKVKGIRQVPYRLPEMLAGSVDVVVVEGEKAVDYLREAGFNATTNVGGAGKFWKSLVAYFHGKRVVAIADNDDVGRDHARKVARLVGGRVLELPGLGPKQGADDWLKNGHSADELRALISQAVEVPREPAQPRPAPEPAPGQGVRFSEQPWYGQLVLDTKNVPKRLVCNSITALVMDSQYCGAFRFNELSLEIEVTRTLLGGMVPVGPMRDDYDSIITNDLQRRGIENPTQMTSEAINTIARQNSYDPIPLFLLALEWDGVDYMNWLHTCLDCEANEYTYEVGKRWLMQCVARMLKPGCQADATLILEGHQGIGKSSALRLLAGDDWFTDSVRDLGSKDAAMQIHSKWIVELSELDAMSRSTLTATKAFLTSRSDFIRLPYARRVVNQIRRCSFAGTTEKSVYLTDDENRRFWPVKCQTPKGKLAPYGRLAQIRVQLLAQAVALVLGGESWQLPQAVSHVARAEQTLRSVELPWLSSVESWLQGRDEITTPEIAEKCLLLKEIEKNQRVYMEIGRVLDALGWVPARLFRGGKQVRSWVKKRVD